MQDALVVVVSGARRAVALTLKALPLACARLDEDDMGKEALAGIKAYAIRLRANGGIEANKSGAKIELNVGLPAGDDQAAHDDGALTECLVDVLERAL